MESATNINRYRRHSPKTKQKIALGNTGKVFSQERRQNIGKAREVVLTEEQTVQLQQFWSKRYVPARWIMKELGLSNRVYLRYLKTMNTVEQVKFLPQELEPSVFETIIAMCEVEKRPYKDIAESLGLEKRQVKRIIDKLAPFYNIKVIPRPRPNKTDEHKNKLSETLIAYNKQFPKRKEKNPNWKGGITVLSDLVRVTTKYKEWRIAVFTRDGFKCINCRASGYLHADHVYPFSLLLEDGKIASVEQAENYAPLWNINNGRTLCAECHRKTETYGKQRKKHND
jgi:hypothetical protein